MVKVKLHGKLGQDLGEDWELEVSSAAEAMRAIEANTKKFKKWIIDSKKDNCVYVTLINNEIVQYDKTDDFYVMKSDIFVSFKDQLKKIDIIPIPEGAQYYADFNRSIGSSIGRGTSYTTNSTYRSTSGGTSNTYTRSAFDQAIIDQRRRDAAAAAAAAANQGRNTQTGGSGGSSGGSTGGSSGGGSGGSSGGSTGGSTGGSSGGSSGGSTTNTGTGQTMPPDGVPEEDDGSDFWADIFSFLLSFFGPLLPQLLLAGFSLLASGITALLAKPPPNIPFEATQFTPAQQGVIGESGGPNSYLFNGPVNVLGEGGPVPVGYGRLMVGSRVCLVSYDVIYKVGIRAALDLNTWQTQATGGVTYLFNEDLMLISQTPSNAGI